MANLQTKPSTVNEMSAEKHGVWHIADNPKRFEPQRSNHFEFVVTDIADLVRAGTTGNESNSVFTDAQEVLRLSIKSAPVPHYAQKSLDITKGNNTIHFAGPMEFAKGKLVFQDYIGAEVKDILMAWQNLSGNIRTGKVGLVEDYKKTGYLIEYSPDYQVVRRWILEGCWISGISEADYDNSRSEVREISCDIIYDKGYIDTSAII